MTLKRQDKIRREEEKKNKTTLTRQDKKIRRQESKRSTERRQLTKIARASRVRVKVLNTIAVDKKCEGCAFQNARAHKTYTKNARAARSKMRGHKNNTPG